MKQINYNENALDAFRILATIQVFLGHVITHFSAGFLPYDLVYFVRGVPILFVLCGFLAAKALSKYSAKEWLFRRAVRILPGFWACIIVNTVVIAIVYQTKPTLIEGAVYAVTQFFGLNFYTGDWLRGYGTGTPNGVLWTIPVQIQFFLLAPLFHKLFTKKKLPTALGVVGGLTVFSILCERFSGYMPPMIAKLVSVTVLPYLYFLVAGMAGWYYRDQIIPALSKWKYGILGTYVLWKIAENTLNMPHIFDGVLYNTITTLLLAMVIFAFSFGWKWRLRHDYTYGFYLYHMVFINLAVNFGFTSLFPLHSGIMLLSGIVLMTLIFAWASQKFVENPCAERLNRKAKIWMN